MTDKEYREQKKRVQKLIPLWRERLGLNSYRLHSTWHRETKEDSSKVGADVTMRWEYLEADFNWYLPALKDLDDDELEECVLHEFCHILVSPLMYEDTDHGRMLYERVTTTVQRAVTYTFEAGRSQK